MMIRLYNCTMKKMKLIKNSKFLVDELNNVDFVVMKKLVRIFFEKLMKYNRDLFRNSTV
jgi:hypothetical protein